jgi:DtxR family Mn-dependent transcriptional regulator
MSEILSASLEDYLKAIFKVVAEKQAARAKDIAARLGVSNSSVTGALRTLADRGLINYAPYDLITLTRIGQTAARDVMRRHDALRDFFVKVLAVDSETAEVGACKMEHEIPPAIVERFIQFVDFVEICPRAGAEWVHGFGYACQDASHEGCAQCVRSCLAEIESKLTELPNRAETILNRLKIGQRAKLIRIGGRGELHKRLVDMGLVPGAIVGVERVAPLGDPIDIKLRGYHLSLRKEEAALVTVEALETVGEPGIA